MEISATTSLADVVSQVNASTAQSLNTLLKSSGKEASSTSQTSTNTTTSSTSSTTNTSNLTAEERKYDVNGDGVLSEMERAAMERAEMLQGVQVQSSFNQTDSVSISQQGLNMEKQWYGA